MKRSLLFYKAFLITTLQLAIVGCDLDSMLGGGKAADEGFSKKVIDTFYCYVYARSDSSISANEVRKHYSSMMRMQAEKFCKSNHVDYYTCFSTRKELSTNVSCEKPSPLPTVDEITQCADDVAQHMSDIQPRLDKRIKSKARLMKQYYSELCSSGAGQNELDIPSYN